MYENKTETPRAIDERGSGEGGTRKADKKKPPDATAAAFEVKGSNSQPAMPVCRPSRLEVSLAVARVVAKMIQVNRARDAKARSAPATAKGLKVAG
jgi:hypothetical protein